MKPATRKVKIDVNIRALYMKVPETLDIIVLWTRGTKKIDTRPRSLKADTGICQIKEKFEMKTALDYDVIRNKFVSKKSILSVHSKDMSQKFGEADFDLSKYANNPNNLIEDKLPLKNCQQDPLAYIDIQIKALILEQPDMARKGMSIIEEKEADEDPKEEFERKEKKYRQQIDHKIEEIST